MHIDTRFSELLGELYNGPLEEPPWQTFLARMRTELDAHLVTLLLRPPSLEDQVVMLADGGSLSAMQSYSAGEFVLDPFVNLPSGEAYSLHEYLSSSTLLASDFYRVIMQPQGWYDFLGLDIRDGTELDVRFRAGRYEGAKAFGDSEKQLLQALTPHLQRSIRLHTRFSRIERERAVYAGAVEQLRVATMILDELGQVLSINDAASALVALGDGIALVDNRPQLTDREANREFLLLLARLRQPREEGGPRPVAAMQVPRRDGRGELGLVAREVPRTDAAQGSGIPRTVLFISDPQQAAEPPQRVVSRLFDLTPTEANLALLLANGMSLDEASEKLSISRNTARAHLRAVFAKTGVARQSGLVRLILRSVAPLADADSI
tara:strand:+ start:7175 stop:8308 length:1134 start_codon:yes stop_codon:yes gene_type:complete